MEKRGRKKKPLNLVDLGFSRDLIEHIEDLCEGGYVGAPPNRVMAVALGHFLNGNGIDVEPEVKKRYLAERERRKAAKAAPNV
jgi:hypothetical protein